MHPARENFDRVISDTVSKCESLFTEVLKRDIHLSLLARKDQMRILNLVTWSERYSIPVKEILVELMRVWQGRYVKYSNGIGVSIATLTGIKSKEILLAYVKRKYPNHENIFIAKHAMQDEMLPVIEAVEFDDPFTYVEEYKEHIKALRKADNDAAYKFKRRKWRGNPFY